MFKADIKYKHEQMLPILEYRENIEGLWNFMWRPRPPSFLPAEKERYIVRSLKTYAKKYEEDDELLLAAAGSEQLERRAHLRRVWQDWRSSKQPWLERQADHLVQVIPLLETPKCLRAAYRVQVFWPVMQQLPPVAT